MSRRAALTKKAAKSPRLLLSFDVISWVAAVNARVNAVQAWGVLIQVRAV